MFNSRARALRFENLETRAMMTTFVQDGVIGIRGTNFNDVIDVTKNGNQYEIVENGLLSIVPNAFLIDGIVIDGRGGNDQITLDSSVDVPSAIAGGKGDDSIRVDGR